MSEQLKPCPFCGGKTVEIRGKFKALLPYKIGSKVWVIDSDNDYSGYVFLGYNENYAFLGSGINGSFDIDDICQYGFEEFQDYSPSAYIVPLNKVFLTKEQAEQALRD